jgi:YD repeat-containing protein
MRNLFLPVFVGALLSITGCKKEDPSFSGAKVLTTTHLLGGLVDVYTYNSSGNVSLITHSSGDKTVFTYTGDTVLMQYIIGNTVVSSATEYLLRGQKYADTSLGFYQAQNNAAKYTYNSDGQLTEQKNYAFGSLSSTYDFTITNKDVVSSTNTNASNGTHTTSYYAYSTNTNTIGNQNFGMGFLGVGTVYLPTTQVQIGANGDTTGILTYKYHYNADTYVDTLVIHDRNGHVIDSLAYSY